MRERVSGHFQGAHNIIRRNIVYDNMNIVVDNKITYYDLPAARRLTEMGSLSTILVIPRAALLIWPMTD